MQSYFESIRIILFIIDLIFGVVLIPSAIIYLRKMYINKSLTLSNIINGIYEKRKFFVFLLIISIIAIIDIVMNLFFTNHTIGSFYEAENYFDEFYVLVSTKPFDEHTTIKKVPATIHSVRGGVENNSYYLHSLHFHNKNSNYSDYVSREIFLNFETEVEDDEGRIYYVQLTTQKVR